jgi:uncharacterized protein (DUF433 family)
MSTMIEAFTPELVRRVTGLSLWQLRHWDGLGVVSPSITRGDRPGEPALYSFRDLIALKVAASLRRKLRPTQMRDLIKQLERRGFDDPFVNVMFAETADGGQVVYIDPDHGALQARGREVGTKVETFGLPLRDLRSGLEQRIEAVTAREPGRVARIRGLAGSEPVIAGTRIPVSKVLSLLDAGWDDERILASFPSLTAADLRAAEAFHRGELKERTA